MRPISRRKFIEKTSLASAAFFPPSIVTPGKGFGYSQSEKEFNLRAEVEKYKKIDGYCTSPPNMDMADKLGIERMYVGQAMKWTDWTPPEFIQANNEMLKLMWRYPGRVVGQISVNPIYQKESLDEIDRCADQGMVGSRLYYQVKINDPLYFPIIQKFSDLKMIIFCHGEAQKGVGGYRMKYDVGRPSTISTPSDFVDVARQFPDAIFQFAHIGGGGDWEFMCRSFQGIDNIYVDLGGSNNEENMVNFAMETLGIDRLLYGTDNSYYQSIGKIMSARLTEKERQKIFYDNYLTILKRGGYHVD